MNVFIINAGIVEIILVADVLYILLLSHIHTAYKTLAVGAKSDQHVNICSFAVHCDRMA